MVDNSESRLEILITIIDKDLDYALTDLYEEYEIPVTLLAYGYGSVKPMIYEMLGYGGSKKTVSLSVHSKRTSNIIMNYLQKKVDMRKPGTGIAFTIDISSINRVLAEVCEKADEKLGTEREDMRIVLKEPYQLIITIVNSGYFEEVMEAAKAADANGGTLIHARSIGSKEAVKYLGITVQPEKDLALILTKKEDRQAIMESITAKAGLGTAAMGCCFSLPVSSVFVADCVIENFNEL